LENNSSSPELSAPPPPALPPPPTTVTLTTSSLNNAEMVDDDVTITLTGVTGSSGPHVCVSGMPARSTRTCLITHADRGALVSIDVAVTGEVLQPIPVQMPIFGCARTVSTLANGTQLSHTVDCIQAMMG
jgi:hypothetical protein